MEWIVITLLCFIFVYSLVSVSKYDDDEVMNKIQERDSQSNYEINS